MSLLRRRAKSRSCNVHGDNGCEIQGEAGPRERAQDKRAAEADIADELYWNLIRRTMERQQRVLDGLRELGD